MEDCLFCKIAAGDVPSNKVYEDEYVYSFLDIDPKAPTHIIFIPKQHIGSANELDDNNAEIIGKIFTAISKVAKEKGFDKAGYRIVNNCGEDGGQTVGHLHFHVLAGRSLQWPPG